MFCLYCGSTLPDDALFCKRCGRHQKETTSTSETIIAVPPGPLLPQPPREGMQSPTGQIPLIQGNLTADGVAEQGLTHYSDISAHSTHAPLSPQAQQWGVSPSTTPLDAMLPASPASHSQVGPHQQPSH